MSRQLAAWGRSGRLVAVKRDSSGRSGSRDPEDKSASTTDISATYRLPGHTGYRGIQATGAYRLPVITIYHIIKAVYFSVCLIAGLFVFVSVSKFYDFFSRENQTRNMSPQTK